MRLLKSLATQSVTALNEYEFRNVNEVQRFLDQLKIRQKGTDKLLMQFMASTQEVTAADDDKVKVKKLTLTGPGQINTKPDERQLPERMRQLPVKYQRGEKGERPLFKNAELKRLAENFVVIEDYLQQFEMLNSARVKIQGSFAGSKQLKQLLRLIDLREKDLKLNLGKAQQFVTQVAAKKIPDSVSNTFRGVVNPVLRNLSGRYKAKSVQVQVNSFEYNGKKVFQFTQYTMLTNLKNDKGKVIPKLYIIVSCAIDEASTHRYFVDTDFRYTPPSKAGIDSSNNDRGAAFLRPKDGLRQLQMFLKLDEEIDVLRHAELPFDESDLSNIGKRLDELVKKRVIDEKDGSVRFIFVEGVTQRVYENLAKTILADIQGYVKSHRALEKLKSKQGKTRGGNMTLTVWFGEPMLRAGETYRDNQQALHRLQDELDLSPQESKKFARILRSRLTGED